MNYVELTQNIQDILEVAFEPAQLKQFVQNTEKAIYNFVRVPSFRKGATGQTTANTRFLTLPADFVWPESIAIINPLGRYFTLEARDFSFMREAYPQGTATGQPKYYGQLDDNTYVLGPIPDANYQVELFYGFYPESIVTANNTWMGDNFGNVLLNGAVTEAARFNKLEPDVIQNYNDIYANSLKLMKDVCDGRRQTDTFRSGVPRVPLT